MLERSQEPNYESGLFTLQFRFPAGESLTIGSFLVIELPTECFSGVFAPRAALEHRPGRHFLWLVDQDTQELELREENARELRQTHEGPHVVTANLLRVIMERRAVFLLLVGVLTLVGAAAVFMLPIQLHPQTQRPRVFVRTPNLHGRTSCWRYYLSRRY